MAQEIERKFLVKSDAFKALSFNTIRISQGYLSSQPERTVRIRIKGDSAYITIKGIASINGLNRYEWENEISVSDANELLKLCEPGLIDKIRYEIPVGSFVFEVDVFQGENSGLIVAEIELNSENDIFEKPDWLGEEVTGDSRFYNSMLVKKPYKKW